MSEDSTQNPNANGWALLGALLKQAGEATKEKRLDELFLLIDPRRSPLTASIRKLGNELNGIVRGLIATVADLEERVIEIEKQLPPNEAA